MKTLTINKPISVTRMGFERDMSVYPQAIEFDGLTHEFMDKGLRYTVKRGSRVTYFFSLSSDTGEFWLRDDGHGVWTLLSAYV